MDEAIAMCRRYAEILGGTLEIDVRLVDRRTTELLLRVALFLDERALDDVVPGAVAAALLEAAGLEQRDGVGQHRGLPQIITRSCAGSSAGRPRSAGSLPLSSRSVRRP